MFPAIMAPTGPSCLEGVALQQFVGQVVAPLLPALQQHLVMALNVIKQPPQGGLDTLFEGKLACHILLHFQALVSRTFHYNQK
jgi:hypothetical protein